MTKEQLQGIDTGCAVAGMVLSHESFIYNIGDCRVYKKEGEFLNQLSKDHTVVQGLIDNFEIDEEEAKIHPNRHVLTSAITPSKEEIKLFIKDIKLFNGDLFFICSDGVWGEFELEELEECFSVLGIEEIDTAIQIKLQTKNLQDNLSYILLEIEL
jgi:protein phosphatase